MSLRRKWLIVTTASLAGIVGSLFLATPRQPRYQGRSLSSWLGDLSNPNFETQRVVRAAIQAMGPATVPFLTNSLAQRDSISLRLYRKNLVPRRMAAWTHRLVKWQTPVMESRSAAVALQSLGPQASNAIPALVAALRDPSWTVTQAAVQALGAMGSNAAPALGERLTNAGVNEMPWVLQAVGALGTNAAPMAPRLAEMTIADSGGATANLAGYALARIGQEAISAITNLLSTTNTAAQLRLLNSLRQMGTQALAATNQLFSLMHHTNPAVRAHARYVLGGAYASKDVVTPYWVEGLRDPDSTNVEVSLRYLTVYPANVLAYNREIAELARHPTNSIAALASNALTTFQAWPK